MGQGSEVEAHRESPPNQIPFPLGLGGTQRQTDRDGEKDQQALQKSGRDTPISTTSHSRVHRMGSDVDQPTRYRKEGVSVVFTLRRVRCRPGPAHSSGGGGLRVSGSVHPTGRGNFEPAYSSFGGWGRSLGSIHYAEREGDLIGEGG